MIFRQLFDTEHVGGPGTEAYMMLRRGRGKPRPSKRRMAAVIDDWENDAVVGTYVTAPEAFAAIRQLGQKTRDGSGATHCGQSSARRRILDYECTP